MKKRIFCFNIFEFIFLSIIFILIIVLGAIFHQDKIYLSVLGIFSSLFALCAASFNLKQKRYAFIFYSLYIAIYGCVAFLNNLYGEAIISFAYNLPLYLYTIYKLYFSKKNKTIGNEFKITRLHHQEWFIISFLVPLIGVGYGFVLRDLFPLIPGFGETSYPFLNSFATAYALTASFLASKTKKEQWIFWIVNTVILVLIWYLSYFRDGNGEVSYLILYPSYLLLNIYGYIVWNKNYKIQREKEKTLENKELKENQDDSSK